MVGRGGIICHSPEQQAIYSIMQFYQFNQQFIDSIMQFHQFKQQEVYCIMYTYQFKQEEVYYIMQLQHFKQQDFFSILQIYHFKQLLLDASIGVKQVLLDHASSTLTSLINLNDNVEENACLLSALYAIHSINKKTCFLSVYYCCAQ